MEEGPGGVRLGGGAAGRRRRPARRRGKSRRARTASQFRTDYFRRRTRFSHLGQSCRNGPFPAPQTPSTSRIHHESSGTLARDAAPGGGWGYQRPVLRAQADPGEVPETRNRYERRRWTRVGRVRGGRLWGVGFETRKAVLVRPLATDEGRGRSQGLRVRRSGAS